MQPTPTPRPHQSWTAPQREARPLKYHMLGDVAPEEVTWLWYPYIPMGKLTFLEGDPGQGKSWITCSLAADLSAGRPLPGQKQAMPPQRVLMLSAEDGLGDTIRPRIDALQGDVSKIFVSDDLFTLDEAGVRELEELMSATAATIVFMDPIVAYLGAKVDMHRANEVRGLMSVLAEMAKRAQCAIVVVRHLRKAAPGKGGAGKALYSGIGSIDFTAAARSVLQVQETKSGQRYMYHVKHNLTPKGVSQAYAFGDGKFQWLGPLDETLDEPDHHTISKTPRAVADAKEFLFELLRDGPQFASEVLDAAGPRGISHASIARAKKGFVSVTRGPDGWVWYLTEREPHDGPTAKTMRFGDIALEKLVRDASARLNPEGKV